MMLLLFAAALLMQADYAAPGPFPVTTSEEGPDCTLFIPQAGARKLPVVLWGNGTRSRVPAYTPMLRHWASHGFLVAAANTNSAGPGAPLIACLDHVAKAHAAKADLTKVGASGHSQGGGGTLMAARDPRIKATAPIQPYTRGLGFEAPAIGAQHAPILLLTGGADATAGGTTDQKPVFDGAKVPVFWATLKDSPHSEPANAEAGNGAYRVITTAWFRWRLMGDEAAGAWFKGEACAVCKDARWSVQKLPGRVLVSTTDPTPGGREVSTYEQLF
jgi:hypothetical protein